MMRALTDTNLFVLDQIDIGQITFVRRRNRLCVEAVHAHHVQRLVAAGCLSAEATITGAGRTALSTYRARRAPREAQ